MIRTLIADDEPLARARVKRFLADAGDFEIVAEAADGLEAARALAQIPLDLALLDIRMPGMSGLEVAARTESRGCLVVFTTAYDQFAIQAFELNAVDYLLKPFSKTRFKETLDRVMLRRVSSLDRVPGVVRALDSRHVERILVKSGTESHFIDANEIEWIEAAGNYVRFHLASGKRHLMRGSLGKTMECLDPKRFARIHRSAAVNVTKVDSLQPAGHGDAKLVTASGATLRVSRGQRQELEAKIP